MDRLKIVWMHWKYIWILYALVTLSTICKCSTFGKILMQNVNNLQKFADCRIFSTFSNACADCWHSATNLRKVEIRQFSTFGVTYIWSLIRGIVLRTYSNSFIFHNSIIIYAVALHYYIKYMHNTWLILIKRKLHWAMLIKNVWPNITYKHC